MLWTTVNICENVDVLDLGHLLSPSVHLLSSFCALLFVLSDLPIRLRMLHLLHFIKMYSLMCVTKCRSFLVTIFSAGLTLVVSSSADHDHV